MKNITSFIILILACAGCNERESTIQRLKAIQHLMDSINNIGFTEKNMTQARYDSLSVLHSNLTHIRDSLLQRIDSVPGLKHDDEH